MKKRPDSILPNGGESFGDEQPQRNPPVPPDECPHCGSTGSLRLVPPDASSRKDACEFRCARCQKTVIVDFGGWKDFYV